MRCYVVSVGSHSGTSVRKQDNVLPWNVSYHLALSLTKSAGTGMRYFSSWVPTISRRTVTASVAWQYRALDPSTPVNTHVLSSSVEFPTRVVWTWKSTPRHRRLHLSTRHHRHQPDRLVSSASNHRQHVVIISSIVGVSFLIIVKIG